MSCTVAQPYSQLAQLLVDAFLFLPYCQERLKTLYVQSFRLLIQAPRPFGEMLPPIPRLLRAAKFEPSRFLPNKNAVHVPPFVMPEYITVCFSVPPAEGGIYRITVKSSPPLRQRSFAAFCVRRSPGGTAQLKCL